MAPTERSQHKTEAVSQQKLSEIYPTRNGEMDYLEKVFEIAWPLWKKITAARNRSILKVLKNVKTVVNILWYFVNSKKKSGNKL